MGIFVFVFVVVCCLFVLPAGMSVHQMCAVSKKSKRGYGTALERELELVVSYQVGAEI